MARKSRKNVQAGTTAPEQAKAFRTAIYARLSAEEKEINSLDNQILMVKNHVAQQPDLALCDVFSDNGMTGTNFNRPGFEALMDNVRRGKIDCIAVKDLSRFGRDYVEAGSYIEIIFPRLGVRFISVGDNYDSFDSRCQGEGMSVALKNMVNSFYAKDISVKTHIALKTKGLNGEYIGCVPPYGYLKSPENKARLIIDPETADVVRRIYAMKLSGMGLWPIAEALSRDGIPTPSHYRYIKGINKDKRYSKNDGWNHSTIRDILRNMVYIGHIAACKSKTINGKTILQPRHEWVISENMHEPIISTDDFNAVAAMQNESTAVYYANLKAERPKKPVNMLKGLVFCADCGRTYIPKHYIKNSRRGYNSYYICDYCFRFGQDKKHSSIRRDELYDVIYNTVYAQIRMCVDDYEKLSVVCSSPELEGERCRLQSQVTLSENRVKHLSTLKNKAYDDYCDGTLNGDEYRLIVESYAHEIDRHKTKIQTLTEQANQLSYDALLINQHMTALERFMEQKELSRELLVALVDRIEVFYDKSVSISFKFMDEYAQTLQTLEESGVCNDAW